MIFIRSLTLQCVQWRGIDCIVLSIACSKLSVKANWVHVKKVPPSFRRKILSQQINVGPWLWNDMKMFSINKRNVFNVGPNVCLTSWHQSGQHSFLNTLKHSLFSQTKSIFRTELCRSSVQSFGRKHSGSASSLAEEYDLSQGTVEVPSSRATQRLEAWAVPCRWTGRRWTSSSERWPSLAPLRSKGETLLACGCARELYVWCCSKVAVSLCQHTHTHTPYTWPSTGWGPWRRQTHKDFWHVDDVMSSQRYYWLVGWWEESHVLDPRKQLLLGDVIRELLRTSRVTAQHRRGGRGEVEGRGGGGGGGGDGRRKRRRRKR